MLPTFSALERICPVMNVVIMVFLSEEPVLFSIRHWISGGTQRYITQNCDRDISNGSLSLTERRKSLYLPVGSAVASQTFDMTQW